MLGFVLAGAENLSTLDFVYLLLLSSAAVVTILYLGSSDYKLFYGAMAVVMAATVPWLLEQAGVPVLPKLQPTLATWIAMVIFLELLPQEKDGENAPPPQESD